MHRISLFLASPSDTAREVVERVVSEVGNEPAHYRWARLELQRWDDRSQPVPMAFLECPQKQVESYKTPPADCDLVIGLLRHKLGTPLKHEDDYGFSSVTGQIRTGTEWELHQATEHKIETWLFRDVSFFVQDVLQTRDEREAAQQHFNHVCDFFDSVGDASHEHKGSDDLESQLRKLLREWLSHRLDALERPSATNSLQTLPLPNATGKGLKPLTNLQQSVKQTLTSGESPEPQQIAALYQESQAPDSIDVWLLRRWAYWTRPVEGVATDAGELNRHFVTLQMMLDRSRLTNAKPLAELDGPRWQEAEQYESLADLLAANGDKSGWVLVGPPGSGKSTVLQHYEMQCCVNALRHDDGNNNKNDDQPEICLWFRLSEYPDQGPEPSQWLAESWQAQNADMPPLEHMQSQYRVRFLLDGLNEIRTVDRNTRARIITQWAQWADRLPGHALPPLFSVRTNEYSNQLSAGGFHATRINLLGWSEEQIKTYIDVRLGPGAGLWEQINTSEQLKFHSLPMTLAHQCELYELYGQPLMQRAAMFSGLMWLRLQRRLTELDSTLLFTDDDAQKVNGERWQDLQQIQQIHQLPRRGYLVPVLEQQALEMQQLGNQVSVPITELTTGLEAEQLDIWLQAVQRLQIAEVEFNDHFRFLHQSWQEYFAARALCRLDAEKVKAIDFSAPESPDLQAVVSTLAVADPLPVPTASRWEETAKRWLELLPFVAEEHLDIAFEQLCLHNPSLAAVAALPIRELLADESISRLQRNLLKDSRNPSTDLRVRIQSALALGQLGDPRYQELTGPKGDRYLMPIDDYLITVSAGRYPIGSAREDATADDDEHWPDGKVALLSVDEFRLSFAPVTHAEFACFVEAGGYDNPLWWRGGASQRWFYGELENTEGPKFWREFWTLAQTDEAKALRRFVPNASAHWVESSFKTLVSYSETELGDWLRSEFGARKRHLPGFWEDTDFSSPTQPVVGVSWFEACAYCEWLSAQSSTTIRLPTEIQWESAARGQATNIAEWEWPWGGVDPEAFQMNAEPAHLRKTSPVGVFPDSDTRDDICDMAGNVWEWCADSYRAYGSGEQREDEEQEASDYRVLRGGSWIYGAPYCRSAYRGRDGPSVRDSYVGFRFAQVKQAPAGAERSQASKAGLVEAPRSGNSRGPAGENRR